MGSAVFFFACLIFTSRLAKTHQQNEQDQTEEFDFPSPRQNIPSPRPSHPTPVNWEILHRQAEERALEQVPGRRPRIDPKEIAAKVRRRDQDITLSPGAVPSTLVPTDNSDLNTPSESVGGTAPSDVGQDSNLNGANEPAPDTDGAAPEAFPKAPAITSTVATTTELVFVDPPGPDTNNAFPSGFTETGISDGTADLDQPSPDKVDAKAPTIVGKPAPRPDDVKRPSPDNANVQTPATVNVPSPTVDTSLTPSPKLVPDLPDPEATADEHICQGMCRLPKWPGWKIQKRRFSTYRSVPRVDTFNR